MRKSLISLIFFTFLTTNLFAGVIATYKVNGKKYNFTDNDLNFYLKDIPVQFRQFILRNKKRFAENIILQKVGAIEAKKEKLDKNPDVKRQIQIQIDRILYKAYLKEKVNKIKISDREVKEYYNKNKAHFIEKAKYKYSQIPLKSKKEAEKVYNEIKKGKKFEVLMAKYQKNPFAALFQNSFREADKLPKKVLSVLKNLKKGEISKPFKYNDKYLIIKLVDKKEPKTLSFEQIKEKIRKILFEKKAEKIRSKIRNRLLKEYKIKFVK